MNPKDEGKRMKAEIQTKSYFIICSIFFTCFLLLLTSSLSVAWATTITADHMEYFGEDKRHVATGNVRIEDKGAVVTADKAVFHQETSFAEAWGHVIYEDDETLINTEHAEINMDARTGALHNALIYFKKTNFRINGDNVKKIKEDHYYAGSATFTSCDSEGASRAAWCFKGKNVDAVIGKRLTADNVSYRIKGLPVLYSPYLWFPVKTERETGFLFPLFGNSSTKGFQFSPSFFWNIADNRDATIYLDYFTKRGLGTGVEYRYIAPRNKGRWYAYHLKDNELEKDFLELKGIHEQRWGDTAGFLDINYVNETDFYKEYTFRRYMDMSHSTGQDFYKEQLIRSQRFLQSTGEISTPVGNSRLYLLSQYWIDLKDKDAHMPQKLPELGYVMDPAPLGPFMFNLSSGFSNFYRTKEARGQRLDIHPALSHALGDSIRLFQSLSLRETAYKLENDRTLESSPHSENLEYRANASARFIRNYETFTHIVEPSLGYRFIPEANSLPLFDSTELFTRTSVAEASLLNLFSFNKLFLSARLTQPYDLNAAGAANPFLPTRVEAYVRGPFSLKFDISHDFNSGRTEQVNSEIGVKIAEKTTLTTGERFTRKSNIKLYKAGIDSVLTQKWAVHSSVWYDMKGKGLRDSIVRTTYTQQCWAMVFSLSRKPAYELSPAEYSFAVFFELKGLGMFNVL